PRKISRPVERNDIRCHNRCPHLNMTARRVMPATLSGLRLNHSFLTPSPPHPGRLPMHVLISKTVGPAGPKVSNLPEDVQKIRSLLATLPLTLGGPAGDFDTASPNYDLPLMTAIKAFQKKRHLGADGVVGPDGTTLAELNKAHAELNPEAQGVSPNK